MCGRFIRILPWNEAHAVLRLNGPAMEPRPRCNAVPSQDAEIVWGDAGGTRQTPTGTFSFQSFWAEIPMTVSTAFAARITA